MFPKQTLHQALTCCQECLGSEKERPLAKRSVSVLTLVCLSAGIRWGRVMALFAYIGALAVQCKENKQEEVLEQIGSWIDSLIKRQLSTWVQHQPRKWVSFFTE